MDSYEIEIKSLLGSKLAADTLREKLRAVDPALQKIGQGKQLNHYFTGGDLQALYKKVSKFFSVEEQARLEKIVTTAQQFSVRTREADGRVLLVVKASMDDATSANGTSRIEFESEAADLSLDELDQVILDAGFSYQAKWSREREEYRCKGITITIDKNAGYGYLAEFERVLDSPDHIEKVKEELYAFMAELGIEELPQDRLERMFTHYNQHWQEYYGTDNIFTIE